MAYRQRLSGATSSAFAGVFLMIAVVGCTDTYPIKIRSAFGPGIRFSEEGSSFDWVPAENRDTGDPRADNPHLHALIQSISMYFLSGSVQSTRPGL